MSQRIIEGFSVKLIDPVSFSFNAATAGGHSAFSYIPGAAILGLVATALHENPPVGFDPYLAFHSGKVRFRNAYPSIPREAPLWPAPRCLAVEKGASTDGVFECVNLAVTGPTPGKQEKALAKPFVSTTGLLGKPSFQKRLRTSIDPATGTAAKGLLFEQEALEAGQTFVGAVEFDADVPKAVIDHIMDFLCGTAGREHRIGRSRATEYGRSHFRRCAAPESPTVKSRSDQSTVIWCISDVWLPVGSSLADEAAKAFGLRSASLLLDRSSIRTRRLSRFNGRWRTTDQERLAIAAGSVLVFSTDGGSPKPGDRWAGLSNSEGVGHVVIDPEFLHPAQITLGREKPKPVARQSMSGLPGGALGRWMSLKSDGERRRKDSQDYAGRISASIEAMYRAATRFNGIALDDTNSPGRSQWNAVAHACAEASSTADLKQRLFDGTNALIDPRDPVWRLVVGLDDERRESATFRSELQRRVQILAESSGLYDGRIVIGEVARTAAANVATWREAGR